MACNGCTACNSCGIPTLAHVPDLSSGVGLVSVLVVHVGDVLQLDFTAIQGGAHMTHGGIIRPGHGDGAGRLGHAVPLRHGRPKADAQELKHLSGDGRRACAHEPDLACKHVQGLATVVQQQSRLILPRAAACR